MKLSKYSCRLLVTVFLSSSLIISGCSKDEAKSLKNTAKLFSEESIAAIDAIETMILKEVQEPIQTEEEAKASFLRIVLRKELSDQKLTDNFERLLNPPQPSKIAINNMRAYMASLRSQYGTLASIYDDLERGHLLAKDAVQKSKIPLEKLTVQMAYIAACVDQNPANLLKDKSKVITEIKRLRRLYFKTKDPVEKKDFEGKILEQFLQWQRIEKNQQELTQIVLEHSTKAAMLGRELRERIDRYDDISLESMNSLLTNVLDIVSTLNGNDYSGLKKQANQLWVTINNDEDFKGSTTFILSQFNLNSKSGDSSETGFSINGCSSLLQEPVPDIRLTPVSLKK